ncbi:MAG TPA: HU family DNA-binding protein [Gemmatimonadota bacterium]|nr:HU family DNA-binding protein [Gemmatimonadota bacterium]
MSVRILRTLRQGTSSGHENGRERDEREERMTKADLVEQIAEATGLTKKDTAVVVDGFLEAVKQALARETNIEIRGFGSFKVKRRKARKARNPRTGDAVYVPGRLVPTFKPSKELKELVMEESPVA